MQKQDSPSRPLHAFSDHWHCFQKHSFHRCYENWNNFHCSLCVRQTWSSCLCCVLSDAWAGVLKFAFGLCWDFCVAFLNQVWQLCYATVISHWVDRSLLMEFAQRNLMHVELRLLLCNVRRSLLMCNIHCLICVRQTWSSCLCFVLSDAWAGVLRFAFGLCWDFCVAFFESSVTTMLCHCNLALSW